MFGKPLKKGFSEMYGSRGAGGRQQKFFGQQWGQVRGFGPIFMIFTLPCLSRRFGTHFQAFDLEPHENFGSGPNQGQTWIQHPQKVGGG